MACLPCSKFGEPFPVMVAQGAGDVNGNAARGISRPGRLERITIDRPGMHSASAYYGLRPMSAA